jgi:hypothetical protein
MMMHRVVSVVLGASLVAAPVAANAVERTPAPVEQGEQIAGSPWIWVLAAAIAVGLLIILIDGGDDEPVSP